MYKYYVNDKAQSTGEHEVHRSDCSYIDQIESKTYLGWFYNCSAAVNAAKKVYDDVDGCYFCCNSCHTK